LQPSEPVSSLVPGGVPSQAAAASGQPREHRAPAAVRRLRAFRYERSVALLTVSLPFIGACVAVALGIWNGPPAASQLWMCLGLSVLTQLGVTVGFHRLFTHRSFKTVPAVQLILGILGSLSVQGPLIYWVAVHRRHHQHSDEPGDPHSPFLQGWPAAAWRGFWHSHIGWMLRHEPESWLTYAPDLLKSRLAFWITRWYGVWVVSGLLFPALLGGLLDGSLGGAASGFLWGGLVRIFVVHHITWSINSVCHLFGSRPFDSRDHSRNNWVCGLLALGEGWHNNHHAFPTSARHGLMWWQLDPSYGVILLLERLGVAWDVKRPAEVRQRGLDRDTGKLAADSHF